MKKPIVAANNAQRQKQNHNWSSRERIITATVKRTIKIHGEALRRLGKE